MPSFKGKKSFYLNRELGYLKILETKGEKLWEK